MQPLQYLTDSTGNRLAVVIPISEWKDIVHNYPNLRIFEQESSKENKVSTQYFMGDFIATLDPARAENLLKHLEESRW